MTSLLLSWVTSANSIDTPFPLNNLPYGVYSTDSLSPRCGVAIGDYVLDVRSLEELGEIDFGGVFSVPKWNDFMSLGSDHWTRLRECLTSILCEASRSRSRVEGLLTRQSEAILHLPFEVSEYTDFYASKHHATNVGTMFRGAENALPPNWLHLPIGYNGRASSVFVSGTDIYRPWGQIMRPGSVSPIWAPTGRFDFELEMGAIVGQPTDRPITVDEADANIFGYVLLNDWSARDIQAFEYQPLGPFQAKATATTISPWIVTKLALEPFRVATPYRDSELLPHLQDTSAMLYSIDLEVLLGPSNHGSECIARTNYSEMYYSSAQQLAHHTSSGCPMRVGDLLGSGTISGPNKDNRGSLLELSWGGKEPIELASGIIRSFIEDGDTITLRGWARGDGYTIGFGECSGRVLPSKVNPFIEEIAT